MQNPQMAAHIAAMNHNGPVDGTPIMGNMPQHKRPNPDPREQLNTYIYDYFLRNEHYRVARAMIECKLKMSTDPPQKTSPESRANGVVPMDDGAGDDLPAPLLPPDQRAEDSFLLDWWTQFWDIYQATRSRDPGTVPAAKGAQYIQHTRNLATMQNEQRNMRMMMNNPINAQYQNMMRNGGIPNGVAPNDLKRAALNNRSIGNPMPNMGQMKTPAMIAAQMTRDGSNMDLNGQRPQSPGSNENAPSPNKRPRMEGGMNAGVPGGQFGEFAGPGQNPQQKNIEVYAQSLAQQHRVALNNTASPQGMNPGVQGSPMAQSGLEGHQDIFAGNGARPGGMPASAPGAPQQGNHALQDYQMQLMLLEQQNKKRLLMARQEQDSMSGPQHQAGVGAQGFPAAMSPQGNRPGPSPNPADQKMRGTPKLGPGMPGSPLPEGAMQPRGSPAPNMNFDPNLAPPGMPPQFYPQMPPQPSPMMRPPSSHPGANFNGQQLTPQQMEAMRNGQMQPNGAWRGPQQPGMMPGQQPMAGPMGNNPQQRQMPPPPAPTNDQPRPEPSPSQSNQAPPTPSQGNKANPKKKGTKDNNKKPANKKAANAGATPVASNGEEPPTPTASTPVAPITPHSKQSFNPQNGQPQQVQAQAQQQPMDNGGPPFGGMNDEAPFDLGLNFEENAFDSFDFDSFLQQPGDDGAFGTLNNDFDLNHVEVGGDL